MRIYRLGACLKCQGDLALDQGDWICLQCGVYYYTGLYNGHQNPGNGLLRIAPVVAGRGPSLHPAASPGETR